MAISRTRSKLEDPIVPTKLGTLWTWGWWLEGGRIKWGWKSPVDKFYPPAPIPSGETVCADELHPGPPYRQGGPLFLTRWKRQLTTVASGVWTIPNTYKYEGRFVSVGDQAGVVLLDQLASISDSEGASSQGPTCWNKFRPVKPKVDLGTFTAELREFKDLFKLSFKNGKLKGAAGAYLNYKFGWTPFIHDIIKAINLTKELDKHIGYVRKNNNKWLKRRGTLFDKIETSFVEHAYTTIFPGLPAPFYSLGHPPNSCKVTTVSHDRCWFEAMWKFYIPDLQSDTADSIFTSKLLRKLYGLEASPSVAWEVLPWSWLVDWFSNVGDNVSNFSNSMYDNLVARYAYVMRHRTLHFITEESVPMNGGPALNCSNVNFCEVKQRAAASPYGFSVDWPDFSASQLAILTALGIQRAR